MSDVVEETVRIAAPPEIVWRYWTDPIRLAAWWGAGAEVDARPGGGYVVEMGGGPVMWGAFVELVPHKWIVFTFGWEPTDGAPDVPPGSGIPPGLTAAASSVTTWATSAGRSWGKEVAGALEDVQPAVARGGRSPSALLDGKNGSRSPHDGPENSSRATTPAGPSSRSSTS